MREHIAERGGTLKTAQNKKSYSVAEIQQILGISRPTAYTLIKKRFIPERPHGQRHPNYKEQL